jgi:hypothetical protein
MILPSKHVRFSESLLGLGAIVLKILSRPMTLDELYNYYEKSYNNSKGFPAHHTFDSIVLAVNFLYVLGAIGQDKSGNIFNAIKTTQSE